MAGIVEEMVAVNAELDGILADLQARGRECRARRREEEPAGVGNRGGEAGHAVLGRILGIVVEGAGGGAASGNEDLFASGGLD